MLLVQNFKLQVIIDSDVKTLQGATEALRLCITLSMRSFDRCISSNASCTELQPEVEYWQQCSMGLALGQEWSHRRGKGGIRPQQISYRTGLVPHTEALI